MLKQKYTSCHLSRLCLFNAKNRNIFDGIGSSQRVSFGALVFGRTFISAFRVTSSKSHMRKRSDLSHTDIHEK